jgi:hypothetical protein
MSLMPGALCVPCLQALVKCIEAEIESQCHSV